MLKIKFLKSKSKIWICCFGFCSYQLLTLIYNFVSFDVRSEIVYNFSKPLEIPVIDFFFPISTILNFSALYHRRPTELVSWCKILFSKSNVTITSVHEFNQHCSNLSLLPNQSGVWLPTLLTVGDVEELTQDPRQVIDQIISVDGSPYDMEVAKLCTKKRFLCGFGVFVRIACRNGSLPLKRENKSDFGGNNFILTIRHRIKKIFAFRFSSHNRNIQSKASKYIWVEPPKDNYYSIIAYFSRQVTISLPWPYKTKCLHYDKDKTMIECMNKHLLNLTEPTIALDSVIPFKLYPKSTRFTNGYLESTGIFIEFLDQCNKLVQRPECREVVYRSNAKVYIDQTPGASVSNTMIVDNPIDTDVHLIAHEKLTLTELLVGLYSVLGVYFGVNIFDKAKTRMEDLNKCLKKPDKEQKLGLKQRAFIVVDPERTFPLYY